MTTRLTPLLLLAVLPGCFRVSHWPVCEEVNREEVADDEGTPAGTADELLARIATDEVLPATWWDGSPTEAQVTVARGDGPAHWVETVNATESHRSFGFGVTTPSLLVICTDALEVPIVASVRSTDDAMQLDLDGPVYQGVDAGDELRVSLNGPFSAGTFPPSEEDPDDWDDLRTFLLLDYGPDGRLSGSAGWSGSRETEEASSATAEYVIDFDAPAPYEPSGG